MEEYKKFIEVTVAGTACNFKCDYCYISQISHVSATDTAHFSHSPEQIGRALRRERIGGTAYINICGVGETLWPKEMPAIINEILKQGHYVNIYTNGVMSGKFDEILRLVAPRDIVRLCVSFSFHYLELLRINGIDRFFGNYRRMKDAGCSVVVNMVLADSYLPYIEDIKRVSVEKMGCYPQVSYPKRNSRTKNWTPLCRDEEKTKSIGAEFDSPYMSFTEEYFNYGRRRFCYAGAWSFHLDLATGWISKCYGHRRHQNIYDDPDAPIKWQAVGNFCFSRHCGGGLFLPQGVVPSLRCPSYADLKDRPQAQWYSLGYRTFLSQQLTTANREYTWWRKVVENICQLVHEGKSLLKAAFRRMAFQFKR